MDINILPDELKLKILEDLDLDAATKFCSTSKEWRKLCDDETTWKRLVNLLNVTVKTRKTWLETFFYEKDAKTFLNVKISELKNLDLLNLTSWSSLFKLWITSVGNKARNIYVPVIDLSFEEGSILGVDLGYKTEKGYLVTTIYLAHLVAKYVRERKLSVEGNSFQTDELLSKIWGVNKGVFVTLFAEPNLKKITSLQFLVKPDKLKTDERFAALLAYWRYAYYLNLVEGSLYLMDTTYPRDPNKPVIYGHFDDCDEFHKMVILQIIDFLFIPLPIKLLNPKMAEKNYKDNLISYGDVVEVYGNQQYLGTWLSLSEKEMCQKIIDYLILSDRIINLALE